LEKVVYEQHPIFSSPEDENERVWRYIDFTKFISLLDRKALYFTRADKFNDKFEGSYSKLNIENRNNIYSDCTKIPELIPKIAKDMRKHVFINCWHLNQYESAAMWNIYTKNNESIAIQSTFKRLKESVNSSSKKIFIGKVNYADYETDWIPEGNVLYPFIYKRKSFEHEKELRAIFLEHPINEEGKFDPIQDPLYDGITVEIDIIKLIETIYISPLADEWIYDLIKSVVKKYNLDFDIKKSDLDSSPVY
jgi:hypothetical protein